MTSEPGGTWKLEPDDQAERLYSLTLALVQTEIGLTKDEIFSAIRGYRMDLVKAGGIDGDLRALNKKFDRDKEKLREIGVSIEPANGSNEGDADFRYKIPRDIYAWPEGTTLSAKQLQLLELAGSIWEHAALSSEASQALTRLRAISEVGQQDSFSAISPRMATIEPSFVPLKRAIAEHVEVEFAYRKPDGQESRRRVQPWQLMHTNGLWMLLGFDSDRQEARNFLLRRIHSKIQRTKTNFAEPSASDVAEAKSKLREHYEGNLAKLQIKPGTTASMHFETHNSTDGLVSVNYLDLDLLAEEILEFGDSVEIVSPIELKKRVEEILSRVIDAHA
ncbi:MAG: hypothetical protein RIS26_767 [Actinomycetota bacterium]|jgi:predicted DNA-binding transcriptional regulator YafY